MTSARPNGGAILRQLICASQLFGGGRADKTSEALTRWWRTGSHAARATRGIPHGAWDQANGTRSAETAQKARWAHPQDTPDQQRALFGYLPVNPAALLIVYHVGIG